MKKKHRYIYEKNEKKHVYIDEKNEKNHQHIFKKKLRKAMGKYLNIHEKKTWVYIYI